MSIIRILLRIAYLFWHLADFTVRCSPSHSHTMYIASTQSVYTITTFVQVNMKFLGRTLIHCTVAGGNLALLKVLQEFKADIEIGVS